MAESILNVRLDALRADLTRIKKIREDLLARQESIQGLRNLLLANTSASLCAVLDHSEDEISELRRRTRHNRDLADVFEALGRLKEEIERAHELLDEVSLRLDGMELSSVPCRRIDQDIEIASPLAQTAIADIENGAEAGLERVDEISLSEQLGSYDQAWRDYAATLRELRDGTFRDYVDFLRGVAVRDAKLDDSISCLADELISASKVRDVSPSLSIPAREVAMRRTLARLIRLEFPGWSFWELPLAAREWGQEVARVKGSQWIGRPATQVLPARDDYWQDLAADAIATFLMGPAYGYAMILLRFDPLSAHANDDKPSYDRRAMVVLEALRQLDPGSPAQAGQFEESADTLQRLWDEAKAQALAGQDLAPVADGNGTNQDADAEFQALADWLGNLRNSLTKPYQPGRWHKVQELRTGLLDDGAPQRTRTILDVNLTDVLNAAWLARVHPDRQTPVDVIEKRARDTFEHIAGSGVQGPGGMHLQRGAVDR